MSLVTLFATVFLVTCTSASKFCCWPERYSSKSMIKTYIAGSFFEGKGDSYFDRDIGMYTSVMNMTVDNGGYSIIHAYFDTKSASFYTVNNGVCIKEHVDMSWIKNAKGPNCIPDDAILASSFVVGGPHEDIELKKFLFSFKNTKVESVVTKHHCFPVQEIYTFGKRNSDGFQEKNITMITMKNLKLSVDDPSVFVLPDSCKKTHFSTKRNNDLPVDPWKLVPFLGRD